MRKRGFISAADSVDDLPRGLDRVDPQDELAIEKKWVFWSRIDPERFVYFCDKYYDRIFSFVLRKVSDREAARDLTQETFNIALQNLWQFRFKGVTIGAWFYRIALSQVSRYHRGRSRMREVELVPERDYRSKKVVALEQIIAGEEEDFLYWCLDQLPESEQIILILYYFEDLAVKEIGCILGINDGAVKSRIHRARRKLAKIVKSAQAHQKLSERCKIALRSLASEETNTTLADEPYSNEKDL